MVIIFKQNYVFIFILEDIVVDYYIELIKIYNRGKDLKYWVGGQFRG